MIKKKEYSAFNNYLIRVQIFNDAVTNFKPYREKLNDQCRHYNKRNPLEVMFTV